MANFLPSKVGVPAETVLGDRDSDDSFTRNVWAQNKGLDRDGDGKITAAEVYADATTVWPLLMKGVLEELGHN